MSAGKVLGIDVGWSAVRATTGLAVLAWDAASVTWHLDRTGPDKDERRRRLAALLARAGGAIQAVAVDGPLRPGLECRKTYRGADSLLSRGLFQRRGKVAPTSCPSGIRLHEEACALADLALEHPVARARHRPAIHPRAIVEAFPNLFFGVLCDACTEAPYPVPLQRRKWTDTFYQVLAARGRLQTLLDLLLPGRRLIGDWNAVRNHEDRAALACALTALGAVLGRYVAVGADDGWVMLPPWDVWGAGEEGRWAEAALRANVAAARRDGHAALVYRDGRPWITA
jgi:hypothetical protein